MITPTFLEARVTHNYPFSPELVFNAWLEPEILGRWMFGPAIRNEEVVSIEVDARVGGEFSFLVKRQELVVDHIGKYLRIEKPTHLEFNWGVKGMSDNSRVIVDIQPGGAGCTLTLVHELDPKWSEYLQRSIDGWGEMLAALERALEAR